MTKKMIYSIVEIVLFIISIILICLSKVEALLLVVGFGFLSLSLILLTIYVIKEYIDTSRRLKNAEVEFIMNSNNGNLNDDEIIDYRNKNKQHNDKTFFVLFSVIATIISLYMFITLL